MIRYLLWVKGYASIRFEQKAILAEIFIIVTSCHNKKLYRDLPETNERGGGLK